MCGTGRPHKAGHAITARHAATTMPFDFGSEPSRGRALTPALAPLSEGRLRHTYVFRHVLVQLLLVKLACPQLTVVVRQDGGVARLLAAAHAKPNRAVECGRARRARKALTVQEQPGPGNL